MIGTLLKAKGQTAIVANGDEARILPAHVVTRGDGQSVSVSDEEWARGVEYGIAWHELNQTALCVSVDELKAEFIKRGLRSSADILAQPAVARAAVEAVQGSLLALLVQLDRGG